MAKGGSGDVLSGLLTGICCLNEEIVTNVAKAAYINGLAGKNASKQRSEVTMTPSDTVENIKFIIENILK
jgi:NAD(P)H-hydrate epimerase